MTRCYLFFSVSGLREIYAGGNEQTRMVSTLEQWLFLSGPDGVGILLGILVRDVLRSYPNFPGGHSHIKVTGMLIGKFKLNPRGPLWVWLKLNLSSKGDFCVVSVRALFVNFFAIPEWARIVTFHPKHPK